VLRLLWLALLATLLVWTLRSVPLGEVRALLGQLRASQIGALLVLNSVIIMLMSARWWIVLKAEAVRIPFFRLAIYRLAAFGLSYFTPGPQVGGEPLQVIYLQKNHGLRTARATASVILDKLLESIANLIFLLGGALVIARVGILSSTRITVIGSLAPLAAVTAIPAIYVGLLYGRHFPLGMALRRLFPRRCLAPARSAGASSSPPAVLNVRSGPPARIGLPRLLALSERMAGAFTRRHAGAMAAALAVSLIGWVGMSGEYWLMARFLGLAMTSGQAVAGLAMALLSFILPIPAGLGALEASQLLALSAMGFAPAEAVSLTLLFRGRDLLFGGIGMVLASRAFDVK
jgi:uncharacterized membrane protein YbhN (UPF0104 family)